MGMEEEERSRDESRFDRLGEEGEKTFHTPHCLCGKLQNRKTKKSELDETKFNFERAQILITFFSLPYVLHSRSSRLLPAKMNQTTCSSQPLT